jgi:GntR family transcriptional regulator
MLNFKSAKPLYIQLIEEIKESIDLGLYKAGDKLLPEIQMASKYEVSAITVRKAMDELESMGLVEKRRGKGTFIASPKYTRDYTKILGFSEACKIQGLTPGSKLLERYIRNPPLNILEKLDLPENAQTIYISRLRYVNGEPMVIECNDFPMIYAYLLTENLDKSLFDILKNKSGVEFYSSRKTIEICKATATESRLLLVKNRHPLLLVRSVACSITAPVYVGSQLINGERYKFLI